MQIYGDITFINQIIKNLKREFLFHILVEHRLPPLTENLKLKKK